MNRAHIKYQRTIMLFEMIDPVYAFNCFLLLIGIGIYSIVNKVFRHGPICHFLATHNIVVRLRHTSFAVPFCPGDLGVIIDCLLDGMYERQTGFLPYEGDTCLDIGANIGAVTASWRVVNSKGLIIAVEPHPQTFLRLRENVRLNEWENVQCLEVALGAKTGILYIDTQQTTSMALVRNDGASGEQTVPSTTLDELVARFALTRIHLCKIDVEGYEVEVLRGAQNSLPMIDKIMLEFHSTTLKSAVKDILEKEFVFVADVTEGARIGLLFAINRRLITNEKNRFIPPEKSVIC